MKIVFDSYAWIEYFLDTNKADIIEDYLTKEEVLTPSIVLLELSYKADKEGWNFKKHLNFIKLNSKIIGFNDDFVLSFGGIYNDIKKKIKGIGFVDIIVLTSALMNDAKILTGDKHFSGMKEAIVI